MIIEYNAVNDASISVALFNCYRHCQQNPMALHHM